MSRWDIAQFLYHFESELVLVLLFLQAGDFLFVGLYVLITEFDELFPYAVVTPPFLVIQEFSESFRSQELFMVIILRQKMANVFIQALPVFFPVVYSLKRLVDFVHPGQIIMFVWLGLVRFMSHTFYPFRRRLSEVCRHALYYEMRSPAIRT